MASISNDLTHNLRDLRWFNKVLIKDAEYIVFPCINSLIRASSNVSIVDQVQSRSDNPVLYPTQIAPIVCRRAHEISMTLTQMGMTAQSHKPILLSWLDMCYFWLAPYKILSFKDNLRSRTYVIFVQTFIYLSDLHV